MDTSRILRFTIPGWVLIFSFIFFFWLSGGIHFQSLSNLLSKDNVSLVTITIAFLVALASSPALGFIASTFAATILHLICGYNFHLKIPTDKNEFKTFLVSLSKCLLTLGLTDKLNNLQTKLMNYNYDSIEKAKKDRQLIRTIYILFNLILRMKAPIALTDYTVRRWTLFWTHINCITSLFIGLAMAFMIRIIFNEYSSNCGVYTDMINSICSRRSFLIIPIILYIIFSYLQLKEARGSAIDIEYTWLIGEANKRCTQNTI